MEAKPHIDNDTPFNMAMLYYVQIQNIMIKLSESLTQDDIIMSKEWLEELYTKVSFRLTEDEEKEIEEFFKKLKIKFELMYGSDSELIYRKQIKQLLRLINRKLLKLMNKYNMIFPEIKLKGLDKLYNRYALE